MTPTGEWLLWVIFCPDVGYRGRSGHKQFDGGRSGQRFGKISN
jgi:hypothetical protein